MEILVYACSDIHFTAEKCIVYHFWSATPYFKRYFIKVLHSNKIQPLFLVNKKVVYVRLCTLRCNANDFVKNCMKFFEMQTINRLQTLLYHILPVMLILTIHNNPSIKNGSIFLLFFSFSFRNVAVIEQTLELTKFKVNAQFTYLSPIKLMHSFLCNFYIYSIYWRFFIIFSPVQMRTQTREHIFRCTIFFSWNIWW